MEMKLNVFYDTRSQTCLRAHRQGTGPVKLFLPEEGGGDPIFTVDLELFTPSEGICEVPGHDEPTNVKVQFADQPCPKTGLHPVALIWEN